MLEHRINIIRTLIERERSVELFSSVPAMPVEIVAVTKAASDEDVLALSSCDVPLAENRWEHLAERVVLVRKASWSPPFHFIGALQRRGTREKGIPVSLIGTVDRENILPVMENLALSHGVVQNILVELDLSGIPGRSGVTVEDLPALLSGISKTTSLSLRGLLVMGVPASPSGDLSETRRIFDRGRDAFEWLKGQWSGIKTLSMGMSGDYLEAVRAGSTQVRLGTILFGKGELLDN